MRGMQHEDPKVREDAKDLFRSGFEVASEWL
jgi:hypothetical protein